VSRIAAVRPTFQKEPRREDPGYLSWLHQGLPCIACLIEGPAPRHRNIEAAHQKLAIAGRWNEGGAGKRTHDDRAVPLCAYHHRHGRESCDNGQRAFWARLDFIDALPDFAAELFRAYQTGGDGLAIVERYAKPRT
jgi:hypothetical protein